MLKSLKALFVPAALLVGLAACDRVPPGNVGVRVQLYGTDKGVAPEVLGPGVYWTGFTQQIYDFPTFTQNYTWTANLTEGKKVDESITFQTNEGLSVNADIGISYHIPPDHVVDVFQKYREGVDEITSIALHNIVRNALVTRGSVQPIESVYGAGKAALIASTLEQVRQDCAKVGIVVENLNWAGSLRLPDSITAAINSKIAATQTAQQHENEVAVAKADADKAVATAEGEARAIRTKAQAEADANLLVARSITPELVQWQALKVWNGALPAVSGGGSVPFVNLQALAAAKPQ